MEARQDRGLTFRMAGLLAVLVGLLLPASATPRPPRATARTPSTGPASGGHGPVREPGRHGSRWDPVQWRGRPVRGGDSTPRPARSTGPTSMATRSGPGTWTARARPTLISADHPCGVAVDPAAGKIYWAEFVGVGTTAGTIRRANLDGSNPETLVSGQFGPSGVAIDPALNKIYWTNQDPGGPNGAVWSADLNGSNPQAIVPSQANPIGVAIDAAAGKIYWTNLGSCCSGPGDDPVRESGRLEPRTLVGPKYCWRGGVAGPAGVALDPGANKLYWANFGRGVKIWNASLTGARPAQLDDCSAAGSPKLPRAAESRARGHPAISGGPKVDNELTCRPGLGRPTCSGRSCTGRRPTSPISGEEGEQRRRRKHRHLHAYLVRRLHLHRDGHQPGRDDLADEPCEEGQGK